MQDAIENESTQKPKKRRRIHVTGLTLKLYAMVAMIFYTVSLSVIQRGLIRVGDYSGELLHQALSSNPDLMLLSGWASVFQLIGGLAVPVYAFLLVEGFENTHSYKRYLAGMLLFAVLSEIPYDLAMYGTLLEFGGQNVLFTLSICLVMLYGLRLLRVRKGVGVWLLRAAVVLAAVLWCSLLRTAFGLCLVLLCAVCAIFREKPGVRILLCCAISLMYVTGPLSAYVLWSYDGERGFAKGKYAFYAFYPLHLLLFGLMTQAMLH